MTWAIKYGGVVRTPLATKLIVKITMQIFFKISTLYILLLNCALYSPFAQYFFSLIIEHASYIILKPDSLLTNGPSVAHVCMLLG
jgi:hypothetical protein